MSHVNDRALDVPLGLVAERMLLSALREQDASDLALAGRQRAEFLADAGLRFGASLDEELTYTAISHVALPGLDGWCIVDVIEVGGTIRRLAVLHADDDKHVVARMLAKTWVPAADDPFGVPAIRKAGGSAVLTGDAAHALLTTARDERTRRSLQELGLGPILVIPLAQRGELLGAVTFVGRVGTHEFSPDDVALAHSLSLRVGQALEAARLYALSRAARAEAETAMGIAEVASREARAARASAERAHGEAVVAQHDAEASQHDAEEARNSAESANASKAHFLSTMSHELRTPLNAIRGYAQLIEMGIRGPVTPEQVQDLESIQRCQAHLLGLVDAVLNYVQVQAGRVTYVTADIPLVEVVAGVHALVAPQMAAKGIDYAFDGLDTTMLVRADADKLRQIVLNLLGNAVKFTPAGGRITVSCERAIDGQAVPMHVVRIRDTGEGIAPEKLSAIFDPFVQVGRRLTSSDVGVGLGLAISRDLARGMGGDLTVESAVGEGSTFVLTLPAA